MQIFSLQKVYFTLLELLVVLFILSIGLGLTGIKIRDVISQQRFYSEIEQIANHLQTAQDMMLYMQTDVDIIFKRDERSDRIQYRIVIPNPIGSYWKKLIDQVYVLKSIHGISFPGQSIDRDEGLILQFYGKGMPIPEGKLILSKYSERDKSDSDQEYQIELLGYPHFIQSQKLQSNSPNDETVDEVKKYQEIYPRIIIEQQKKRVEEEVRDRDAT